MIKTTSLFYVLLLVFCGNFFAVSAQKISPRVLDYSDNERPAIKGMKEDSFRKLHIVLAGNIYKTELQIKEAYDSSAKRYDFSHELRNVAPILNLGDVVIAQLKTTFTGDIFSPYSAPDEFALSIKYAGINQCVLANSNTARIDSRGLLRTQRALGVFDIQTTGAYIDALQRQGNYPRIIERKGFKIALLNYSSSAKRPASYIINQPDGEQIERDMKLVHDQKADYVIVFMDWGENMQEAPSSSQEQLGRFLLEQGANLVVGTFPNTVQRIDHLKYSYQGKEREGYVAYSLGNLLSGSQSDRDKRGAMLDVEIWKNNFSGEIKEGDVGFIPIWNYYDVSSKRKKQYALPMAAVEQEQVLKNRLPEIEMQKMKSAIFGMRGVMGRYCDEIQYNVTDVVIKNVEEAALLTNAPMNNRFNPYDYRKLKPTLPPVAKERKKDDKCDTIYRIQFYELSVLIPIDTNYYSHLRGYEVLKENGSYKYLLSASTNYERVKQEFFREIKPRYKEAMIVLYCDGRRIKEIPLPR